MTSAYGAANLDAEERGLLQSQAAAPAARKWKLATAALSVAAVALLVAVIALSTQMSTADSAARTSTALSAARKAVKSMGSSPPMYFMATFIPMPMPLPPGVPLTVPGAAEEALEFQLDETLGTNKVWHWHLDGTGEAQINEVAFFNKNGKRSWENDLGLVSIMDAQGNELDKILNGVTWDKWTGPLPATITFTFSTPKEFSGFEFVYGNDPAKVPSAWTWKADDTVMQQVINYNPPSEDSYTVSHLPFGFDVTQGKSVIDCAIEDCHDPPYAGLYIESPNPSFGGTTRQIITVSCTDVCIGNGLTCDEDEYQKIAQDPECTVLKSRYPAFDFTPLECTLVDGKATLGCVPGYFNVPGSTTLTVGNYLRYNNAANAALLGCDVQPDNRVATLCPCH